MMESITPALLSLATSLFERKNRPPWESARLEGKRDCLSSDSLTGEDPSTPVCPH